METFLAENNHRLEVICPIDVGRDFLGDNLSKLHQAELDHGFDRDYLPRRGLNLFVCVSLSCPLGVSDVVEEVDSWDNGDVAGRCEREVMEGVRFAQ